MNGVERQRLHAGCFFSGKNGGAGCVEQGDPAQPACVGVVLGTADRVGALTSGKPTENARVESFHRRLREECLTVSWFQNRFDARRKIAAWRTCFVRRAPKPAAVLTEVWSNKPLNREIKAQ
jgi:hypothetical protein